MKAMKYLVLKTDDMERVLSDHAQGYIEMKCREIQKYRQSMGKKDNLYLVINTDEPYAGRVADMIETIERRKGTWEYGNKTMREVMGIAISQEVSHG